MFLLFMTGKNFFRVVIEQFFRFAVVRWLPTGEKQKDRKTRRFKVASGFPIKGTYCSLSKTYLEEDKVRSKKKRHSSRV
jgi:hypothetical protein